MNSKADEMFRKVGYKQTELIGVPKGLNICFAKETGDFINFIPGLNGITISENNALFVEELQAINEKCKELGWLGE